VRVVIERVSKVYAGRAGHTVRALDGIDLVVDAEEFVAVLGPSGCGKSTLLNMVAGLLAPTEGAIWLEPGAIST
jgi:NitT/TauT family transport system ATP-binding protein